ncbi:hypothetical protein ACNQFZ_06695 [Schinkia sp. CFF1]
MFMTKTRLRFATDHYRDVLIKQLTKAGYSTEDGRSIDELSIRELIKEWQIVKVRGIDKMELLVVHFMREYKLTRKQAEKLLNESLADFDVMRSILKAANRKVITP